MHETAAAPAEPVAEPGPRLVRRRVVVGFAIAGGGALLAVGMLGGLIAAFWLLSWPHAEPLHKPVLGINYDCNQAEYLLLEDPALGPAGYVRVCRFVPGQW